MKRKAYPTDLTQKQFKRIEPLLPKAKPGGRPRSVDLYEVLCAIMYVLQGGIAWRSLPHEFPAWQTVYAYFRRFEADGTWEAINHSLVRETRKAAGRDPEPSAGILDAQTVRCSPQAGPRGVDAGKSTNGRKRNILVDTMGLLLVVLVTTGCIQDRDGGKITLWYARRRFPRLRHVWADGGYAGKLVDWAKEVLSWTLEIVKRSDGKKFQILPRRWVVKRSFSWLTRSRRLVRDYEGRAHTTETWCYIANIRLMLRRLEPRQEAS